MSRLKLVNQTYAYSYQWYNDIIEANLSNFTETIYHQISKGLKRDEKIMAAILIAEVTHPNLPWRCLFGVEDETSIISNVSMESQGDDEFTPINLSIGATIERLVNNLPVTQEKWESIIGKAKRTKKYLPTLE